MAIKKGDKVKVKSHDKKPIGVITEVIDDIDSFAVPIYTYVVEFADPTISPSKMECLYKDLELVQETKLPYGIKRHTPRCECGVDSCRSGGRHSDWCPFVWKNKM